MTTVEAGPDIQVMRRATRELEVIDLAPLPPIPSRRRTREGAAFDELLQALVDDLADRYGRGASVERAGDWTVPCEARGVVLYAVGEALRNAFEHGDATAARVLIDGDRKIVSIVDDGHGFNPMMRPPGRGLLRMRQGAGSVGASFRVSSYGRGRTTVEIAFA